jgi:hypothetical protein
VELWPGPQVQQSEIVSERQHYQAHGNDLFLSGPSVCDTAEASKANRRSEAGQFSAFPNWHLSGPRQRSKDLWRCLRGRSRMTGIPLEVPW